MVELVDASDLESDGVTRAGSIPVIRIKKYRQVQHPVSPVFFVFR